MNCILHNPLLALSHLNTSGALDTILNLWFSNLNMLVRVHDKKLSVLSLLGILEVIDIEGGGEDAQRLRHMVEAIGHALIHSLSTLEESEKARDELVKMFEGDGDADDDASLNGSIQLCGENALDQEEADDDTDASPAEHSGNFMLECRNNGWQLLWRGTMMPSISLICSKRFVALSLAHSSRPPNNFRQ